jgi:hypothetical protein
MLYKVRFVNLRAYLESSGKKNFKFWKYFFIENVNCDEGLRKKNELANNQSLHKKKKFRLQELVLLKRKSKCIGKKWVVLKYIKSHL